MIGEIATKMLHIRSVFWFRIQSFQGLVFGFRVEGFRVLGSDAKRRPSESCLGQEGL